MLGHAQEVKPKDSVPVSVVKPLLLDRAALSGLGLQPVSNANEPDRRLFQKNLYRGPSISVYIVSSETASKKHEDYGIDEFIYLINGRARLNPDQGEQVMQTPGDFFFVPKGYAGEWETQGGTEFYHELSVISTRRSQVNTSALKAKSQELDKDKIAGVGITKVGEEEHYFDELYSSVELKVQLEAEPSGQRMIVTPLPEQLIYIVAGSLSLTPTGGESETFYTGDFVVLPDGFTGEWNCEGHHLFRSLRVLESKN